MKVVTFGELMIRLQPYNYERFVQADHLEFTFGGGEANVAVSLANYGMDVSYVTKLPAHAIGQAAVNSLRRYGVDTSKIVRGGDRVGIYFNEKGASQRGSVCIYDRAHSAIQEATTADFDWDAIFEGVDWFHFTGITPALGPNVVEICKEACKAAKAKGVKISCDLNYRGKLWTREEARAAMTELCRYVDVCISNEEDAKDVFGIEAEGTDITGGRLNKEGYQSVARQLAERFGFEVGRVTVRAARTKWGSCSARNDISLSLFLAALPRHLQEFVIIHELCHTVHHNHSAAFHALVDRCLGGRERELEGELKRCRIPIVAEA